MQENFEKLLYFFFRSKLYRKQQKKSYNKKLVHTLVNICVSLNAETIVKPQANTEQIWTL